MEENKTEKKGKIKTLFITDIDGTLTDGNMHYGSEGHKDYMVFNTKDTHGLHLLKENDIRVCFISGTKERQSLRWRCFSLKVNHLIEGSKDKVKSIKDLQEKINIPMKDMWMIGDDTNDIPLMKEIQKAGGKLGCPQDANYKVKELEGMNIMQSNGGKGAVRNFIDMLLKETLL